MHHSILRIDAISIQEGAYDAAEIHLLAAGKRDSARLLSRVFIEWGQSSGSVSSHVSAFALRGTIPCVVSHLLRCLPHSLRKTIYAQISPERQHPRCAYLSLHVFVRHPIIPQADRPTPALDR